MLKGSKGKRKWPMRRAAMWTIKLAVTAAVCVWLAHNVDWPGFRQAALSLHPAGLFVLLGLSIAGIMLSAWKWQILLRMHGVNYRYMQLMKWYFTGAFISVFLPTSIGGDAYRIYRTYKNPKSRMSSVLAVTVERVTGLLALLFMGYVAAIVSYFESGNPLSYWAAITGSVGIPVGVVLLFIAIKLDLLNKLAQWPRSPKFLASLITHAKEYLQQPRDAVYVMLLSFAFHLVRISGMLCLLYLFDAQVSVFSVFVVAALTTVIGMVPLSIGGFGVIEGSFTYLMSLYGLPTDIGLSTILIFRIAGILVALLGVVFYWLEKEPPVQRTDELLTDDSAKVDAG